MTAQIVERLEALSMPEPNSGCWLWLGAQAGKGYGSFGGGRKTTYAHGVSYEAYVGPIPNGLTIDHLCKNRACINPQHLEVVSMRENILRSESPTAKNARKSHCPHGHAFTAENTYVQTTAKGQQRSCLTCRRDRPGKYRNTVAVQFSNEQMARLSEIANGARLSTTVRDLLLPLLEATA